MELTASSPTSDCLAAHLPDDRTRQDNQDNTHYATGLPPTFPPTLSEMMMRGWTASKCGHGKARRLASHTRTPPILQPWTLTCHGLPCNARYDFSRRNRWSCWWHAVKKLDPVARLRPRLTQSPSSPHLDPPHVLQTASCSPSPRLSTFPQIPCHSRNPAPYFA